MNRDNLPFPCQEKSKGASSCCRSSTRKERATVGTAKVHAVSPGLGKRDIIEGRRKNLWNDGGPGPGVPDTTPFSFLSLC